MTGRFVTKNGSKRWFCRFILVCSLVFSAIPAAEALQRCESCQYPVSSDASSCPKCLRKLKWPLVPERSRKARIIVRTGYDAFIRHRNARVRLFRDDRNTGGDSYGYIGSWGGTTTLRYLLRFDIPLAFARAHVSMNNFQVNRALLKLSIVDPGIHSGLPIKVRLLSRHFRPGTGKAGTRKKIPDGCDWFYSMPLMLWHREGGDYIENPAAQAILAEDGCNETTIDVTELIKTRFDEFAKTGIWNDPGLIIMRDSTRYGYHGYLTVHSFETGPLEKNVRSPELFIN